MKRGILLSCLLISLVIISIVSVSAAVGLCPTSTLSATQLKNCFEIKGNHDSQTLCLKNCDKYGGNCCGGYGGIENSDKRTCYKSNSYSGCAGVTAQVKSATCKDSDNGFQPFIKGNISGIYATNNQVVSFTQALPDRCKTNGLLVEWYCNNSDGKFYAKDYNCSELPSYICQDGICKKIIPTSPSCIPYWTCTWSNCIDNQQTKTCIDSNNCGTTQNKPAETQTCSSLPETPSEINYGYPAEKQNNMVLLMHMDGNFADSSGKGNDGISQKGAITQATSARLGTHGGFFDGVDDYVDLGNKANLKVGSKK